MALLLEYVADFSAEQPAEIMEWVTCDQAFCFVFVFFFFRAKVREKCREEKKNTPDIFICRVVCHPPINESVDSDITPFGISRFSQGSYRLQAA